MMRFLPIVAAVLTFIAVPRRDYGLDHPAAPLPATPQVPRVLAPHESGMRPNAVNRNTNGSEDIGLMQINTSWLPTLARYGIRREHLFNGCVSAYVGAWILASNVRRFGPNWKAVGAYNAVTPSKQLVYASAIYRRFMQQGR